jgi:pre-mRNA-splicing factor 38B
MQFGQLVRMLLTKVYLGCFVSLNFILNTSLQLDFYGTLFPRIPIPIQKDMENKFRERAKLYGYEDDRYGRGRRSRSRSKGRERERHSKSREREKKRPRSKERDNKDKRSRSRDQKGRSRSTERGKRRSRDRNRWVHGMSFENASMLAIHKKTVLL